MEDQKPNQGSDALEGHLVPWAILAVVVSIWLITNIRPPTASATIPYTGFLAEVRHGNVAKVSMRGDQIAGTFIKPVKMPSGNMSATTYESFKTTFPQTAGDSSLMPLLESHKIAVDITPTPSPWLLALIGWLPLVLLFGYIAWMMRKAGHASISSFAKAAPKRYTVAQGKITFLDVAGADEAKADLQEEVDFLRHPNKYHALGARIPKGILLVGAPGTGKTLLARAVAGEAGVPFFSLNASEFVEMYVGVGASRVRDLFKQAKAVASAIVFIDEIDAVGKRRTGPAVAGNDEREQTLNQLLGELDGFDERVNIIVLAATNRPDVLDPALLRPGRFDRQVAVPLPDRRGRDAILKVHARKLTLSEDIDFAALACTTIGMSGADLMNLCNEAALTAARHNHAAVCNADFEQAADKLRLGSAHAQLIDPDDRRIVAYHESGHAIVAWMTPGAEPVRRITIVPHGQAMGLTEQLPTRERRNFGESYLRGRLAVMLGGRTAEELIFNEVTTGAHDDLKQATSLARQMVTSWGMGSSGLAALKSEDAPSSYELASSHDYSAQTAMIIDRDIQRLLEGARDDALRRLNSARPQLQRLAELLLKEETVPADVLREMLGPPPTAEREMPKAHLGVVAVRTA